MRGRSSIRREPGGRPIYVTPLGLHTRYMLAAYLRHTLMVAAALMTIALTIDLWPQISPLAADPAQKGFGLPLTVVRLAALRVCDLLPPFVPFDVFLGVVWSESAFTEARERMLIWNSGRSPLLCLMPALLAGLLMGAALFVVDAWLRPAAIAVQIAEKLGREGIRLDRTQSGRNQWIALPDGLLRAQVAYGPPVRLHDVIIYKLDRDGHLAEVDTAALATPLPGNLWQLTAGHYWRADFDDHGDILTTGDTSEEAERPFQQRMIPMALNVLWLHNLGMSPQYLSLSDLRRLSHGRIISRDQSDYRTRLQVVFGETLLTCAMALLGAVLSMFYFGYHTRWRALVVVLLAGYLAHFASKAFYLMGEFGYISPIAAGWLAPLLVMAGVARMIFLIQRQRGLTASLRTALRDTPHFTPQF